MQHEACSMKHEACSMQHETCSTKPLSRRPRPGHEAALTPPTARPRSRSHAAHGPAPCAGCELRGVRFDAVPLRFDARAFREAFLAHWPPGE